MTSLPRLGDWITLTGPPGARLAAAGDHVAAAALDTLAVWRGGELLATAAAGTSVPGRPRFVRDAAGRPTHVCWATVLVELATASVRSLDGLAAAVIPEPVPRVTGRGGGSAPQLSDLAWSADGSMVLVSRQDSGAPASLSASAALFGASGEPLGELWQGSDLGPVAGLVGPDWAVVGSRQPVVFSFDGSRLAVLDGATPPRRIETDLAASRLLTVETPALRLWDTSSWRPVAAAEGPWADAALAPDAGSVLAVDYDGRLQLLDAALRPAGSPDAPGPPDGVALGERLVAAATGGTVRSAELLTG